MSPINEQTILNCLDRVIDPKSGKSVVALGLVTGLVIKDGNVGFALEINPAEANEMELLRKKCEQAVFDLPGVKSASVVLTAEQAGAQAASSRPARPQQPQQQPAQKPDVPGVAAIIAVASGKGG